MRRRFCCLSFVLILGAIVFVGLPVSVDVLQRSGALFGNEDPAGGTVKISAILDLISSRLRVLKAKLDSQAIRNELGLRIEYGDVQDDAYSRSLTDTYKAYFYPEDPVLPVEQDELYHLVTQRASVLGQIEEEYHKVPQKIYATAPTAEFPDQFQSWAKLNSDWQVKFYDNKAINAWIGKKFAPILAMSKAYREGLRRQGLMAKSLREKVSTIQPSKDDWEQIGLVREMAALPDNVLKGIYTDTDTACVKPLDDWPGFLKPIDSIPSLADPLISVLPSLLELRTRKKSSKAKTKANHAVSTEYLEPPSLVVALENDAFVPGALDWRGLGMSRGLQFVQWSIAAQPGHPVFLDVLGRILRGVESHRSVEGVETDRKTRINEVLDWTGPGAFSDAVFRYLLARWGVHPKQIANHPGPVRVGDVLIYNQHTFRADASEGDQGDNKLVWHGFHGSWKPPLDEGDIGHFPAEISDDQIIG